MKVGVGVRDGTRVLVGISGRQVIDVGTAARLRGIPDPQGYLGSLGAFLAGAMPARELAAAAIAGSAPGAVLGDVVETRLEAPLVPGAKILCHVINYTAHGPAGVPSRPFFFYKPGSSVIGDGDFIQPHRSMSDELDWETELAVVIGRRCRDVDAACAYDVVAGYTILNDVSYRNLQFNREAPDLTRRYGMNWTQGKGLDGSCPIGPWIVLADELAEPYPLRIVTSVNGQPRQEGNTGEMIFKVPELIAEASRGMTLWPGDIIATGTPSGTALDAGGYLTPGDVVRCEVDGIGVLENTVGMDETSEPNS